MCVKERRGKERSPRPSLSSFSHFLQHHGSQCATLETGSADRPHVHNRSASASKRPAVPPKVKQKTETTNKRLNIGHKQDQESRPQTHRPHSATSISCLLLKEKGAEFDLVQNLVQMWILTVGSFTSAFHY